MTDLVLLIKLMKLITRDMDLPEDLDFSDAREQNGTPLWGTQFYLIICQY
jgi:hypothetical protein